MATTPTRRVMQLTQRYVDHGMNLTEARRKANERVQFEKDIEVYCTPSQPPLKVTTGGK